MSSLLKILCIAVTLFYFNDECLSAAVKNHVKEDVGQLLLEFPNWKHRNHTEICFVHALNLSQNLSVAEASCRAVKSLNQTCTMKYNIETIRRNLERLHKDIKCVEHKGKHEGEEDLHTFLHKLRNYFQQQNFTTFYRDV